MTINTRHDQTRQQVEALEGMNHQELKQRYFELTGDPPPKCIGRTLLKLAVAYKIQRKDHNAVVTRVHRKLSKIAEAQDVSVAFTKPQRRIKPGGRLVREWRGNTYEVYVADDGQEAEQVAVSAELNGGR